MISDYLMKGIDSLFSRSLATQNLGKDTIKSNLHSVLKNSSKPNHGISPSEKLNKSRHKVILERNRGSQLKSVIKRDNSRSVSPYQCISPADSRVGNR